MESIATIPQKMRVIRKIFSIPETISDCRVSENPRVMDGARCAAAAMGKFTTSIADSLKYNGMKGLPVEV